MIHTGDCIEVMAGRPADSVDAVVTDPPYGIEFMGRKWDSAKPDGFDKRTRDTAGVVTDAYARLLDRGPSNYIAGTPFQQWCQSWGTEALRVTKPGGYLLAFGGTRTHHRLVCGLEDAGWIIRDELDWIYASGFPKGKANLKPAHEPIVLARKPGPLRPLGIEECRIPGQWTTWKRADGSINHEQHSASSYAWDGERTESPAGRWPSNLLLSDPELFDEPNPYVVGSGATSESASGMQKYRRPGTSGWRESQGMFTEGREWEAEGYGDSGGYSRFFLVPKSSKADREPVIVPDGHDRSKRFSSHPTVKPTDLMRHLVRLVTPSGGTVLDPFLGSGSTAIACELEGFPWIGIEKEPEYVAIAEARLNGTQRGLGLDVGAPTRRGTVGMHSPPPDKRNPHAVEGWGFSGQTTDAEPAA